EERAEQPCGAVSTHRSEQRSRTERAESKQFGIRGRDLFKRAPRSLPQMWPSCLQEQPSNLY
ncbi:MAG: hypothetical protein V1754_14985, partial [Pseudomonadota bacterium]